MNPWIIAGGGAALLALLFGMSSSSTTASQNEMQFRDYQWTAQLPTYTGPGGDPANPLAKALPAPPAVTTPGKWMPFPGGWWVPGVSGAAGPNTPTFQVFGQVPAGVTVWAWRPSIGVTKGSTANITKLNGYWVSWVPWQVATTQQAAAALGIDPNPHGQPVSPANPSLHSGSAAQGSLVPPPGETATSGKWDMWAPGYIVWITPSNEHQAQALANAATLGPTSAVIPGAAPYHAPQVVAPQPSPTPIAVTPPAVPAPAGG